MKRWIMTALCLVLLLSALCVPAAAEEETVPQVCVDDVMVEFPDAQPFIDANSRTMIPVRFVSEAMGADVSWEKETSTAVISRDGITVRVKVGDPTLTVEQDGQTRTVTMNTAAVVRNNRTYVPIRYVAEALGAFVDYSSYYKLVEIVNPQEMTAAEIKRLRSYPLVQSWLENNRDTFDNIMKGNYYIATGYYKDRPDGQKLLEEDPERYSTIGYAVVERFKIDDDLVQMFTSKHNAKTEFADGHHYLVTCEESREITVRNDISNHISSLGSKCTVDNPLPWYTIELGTAPKEYADKLVEFTRAKIENRESKIEGSVIGTLESVGEFSGRTDRWNIESNFRTDPCLSSHTIQEVFDYIRVRGIWEVTPLEGTDPELFERRFGVPMEIGKHYSFDTEFRCMLDSSWLTLDKGFRLDTENGERLYMNENRK